MCSTVQLEKQINSFKVAELDYKFTVQGNVYRNYHSENFASHKEMTCLIFVFVFMIENHLILRNAEQFAPEIITITKTSNIRTLSLIYGLGLLNNVKTLQFILLSLLSTQFYIYCNRQCNSPTCS